MIKPRGCENIYTIKTGLNGCVKGSGVMKPVFKPLFHF